MSEICPFIFLVAGDFLFFEIFVERLKNFRKQTHQATRRPVLKIEPLLKVAIIANLATSENEKMFADKVENMSKPALQEYSKELRGKISGKLQTTWQIELDQETMTLFLKLKGKLGKFGNRLSNKEALRRMLKIMENGVGKTKTKTKKTRTKMMLKNLKPQTQANISAKIPGERHATSEASGVPIREFMGQKIETKSSEISWNYSKIPSKNYTKTVSKITRYIPVARKHPVLAQTNGKCSEENCPRPAEVFHHQTKFSQSHSHDSIIPLYKIHHEFAHNGITESETEADILYRRYRIMARR